MKGKQLFILSASIVLLHFFAAPGISCVGRTLTIAHDKSVDQQVMSRILAVFIQERTGTTINLVEAADVNASRKMVEQEKADIYMSYLATGLTDTGGEKGENSQESYSLVKQHYLQQLNMVWLKPFGYKGPITTTSGAGNNQSMASAVATRKTLERFPILERVINKLDGLIDEKTLTELKEKAGKKDIKGVVKKYLKSRNMI